MHYPPSIARNGRSGFSSTFSKYLSSFSIRNPATRCLCEIPTIELKKSGQCETLDFNKKDNPKIENLYL